MNFIDRDLLSIQEARILSENAKSAQKNISLFKSDKLNKAFEIVYKALKEDLFYISKLYVEESGYGNVEQEYKVNELLLEELYSQLYKENIFDNTDNKAVNIPIGGVILVPSCKNTVLGIINTILLCLKTGNVLIVASNKRSLEVTKRIVDILTNALQSNDYPADMLACLTNVSDAGILELLNYSSAAVIINLGEKEFIEDCNKSGKVFYYGSTGASPVFIERSADVGNAIYEVVKSRSFNNGTLPGAEQFLIVDEPVSKVVVRELKNNKAYIMNENEESKLIKMLIKNSSMDEELVGKSASELAKQAEFDIPPDTSILVSVRDYISEFDFYIKELSVPVLIMYTEYDWINACEKCIKLLTKEHDGHSLSIYSKDERIISEFINKKPVGRIMVNTNTSFSAMGIGSDAYPSAILGVFTRGIGCLSENLSPKHLVYKRSIVKAKSNIKNIEVKSLDKTDSYSDIEDLFKSILYK